MNRIAAASGTFTAFGSISRMLTVKRIWTCHMEFALYKLIIFIFIIIICSFLSTQSSVVTSPGSQSSAVERFHSLVSKVEETVNLDVDIEMVVIAAMVACGNDDEGHLISWCLMNGSNERLVSKKYSEAQNDPRYSLLLSRFEDEHSTSHCQRWVLQE